MTTRDQFLLGITSDVREARRLEAKEAAIVRKTLAGLYPRGEITVPSIREEYTALRACTSRRLVFADWLEEEGEEEQAEKIRVDCELAKPFHCHFSNHAYPGNTCQPPYCKQCRALKLHSAALRKRLNPFADLVKVTWRFGLIEEVEFSGEVHFQPFFNKPDWYKPYREHPIHTIRLRDWHGLDRSLPRDPDALPWLGKIILPESLRLDGMPWNAVRTTEGSQSFGVIQRHFGRIGETVCNACEGQGWIWIDNGGNVGKGHCHDCHGPGTVGGEWRVQVEFAES